MQTLQVTLSKGQYEKLRDEAAKRHISMDDLVLEAIELFLNSAAAGNRYARLAHKQAAWRARQGVEAQAQPYLPGVGLVRERAAGYTATRDQSLDARMAHLRLDLIYHSEALEGSPLTRTQVEDAIRELSTR